MKLVIISFTLLSLFNFCKGPLQRETFTKVTNDQTIGTVGHTAQVKTEKTDVKIDQCEGCITISGLIGNKSSFSGKVIRVKGIVTKVNPAILDKNWIHIQDGTDFNGVYDLTITSDVIAMVGDTITFEGKIVLDKDFGYGYVYSVLMEDGKAVQ